MSAKRKGHLKARWNQYKNDIEVFKKLFNKAEESNFLKGRNDRNWKADFDWIINDNNMAKILENRYENKEDKQNGLHNRDGDNKESGETPYDYDKFFD